MAFQAQAIAQDGLAIDARPTNLGQGRPIPGPRHIQDPTSARFKLNARGASLERFLRWFVIFAFDEKAAELEAVIAKFIPNGQDTKLPSSSSSGTWRVCRPRCGSFTRK